MQYPDNHFPGGVWPVMLTPYKTDGSIDENALISLVNWYIENGASGLFAACQSSEIFELSREERVQITDITVKAARGRVPVVASGHTSPDLAGQAEDIKQIWNTGVDAVILLTNRLAYEDEDDDCWLDNYTRLADMLDENIKLGVYECPKPYKRLLTEKVIRAISASGRFYFLKDTCCDATEIRKRLSLIKGTNLKLYNANSTTLLDSLNNGAAGYSGIMANFHPQLYAWLCSNFTSQNAAKVHDFLSISSLIERQLYPVNAKYHLQHFEGLPMTTLSRVQNDGALTPTFRAEVEMLNRLSSEVYAKAKACSF